MRTDVRITRIMLILIFAASSGALYYFMRIVDPGSVTALQFAAVYLLIFASVCSAITLIFPLRQGVLFAALVCFALWLLASALFSLLTAALALLIFTLLEVYAISN